MLVTGILSLPLTESGISLRSFLALNSGLRLTSWSSPSVTVYPPPSLLWCTCRLFLLLTKMNVRRPLHHLHLVYCHPPLLTLYVHIVQIWPSLHMSLLPQAQASQIQSHPLCSLLHQICLILPSQSPDLSAPTDPQHICKNTYWTNHRQPNLTIRGVIIYFFF